MYKKYTAEITLSKKPPRLHTKNYTDFPIWRKKMDDQYKIDDDKMFAYFDEPFQDDNDLLTKKIAGDYLRVDDDGKLEVDYPRKFFSEPKFNVNDYNYAKVKLFYDDSDYETFYGWIISKQLKIGDLTTIMFVIVMDIIPNLYRGIKEQKFYVIIDRMSQYIYKDTTITKEEELKRRLARKKYNISCDDFCQAEETLFYTHHFKSKYDIVGTYFFDQDPGSGVIYISNNELSDKILGDCVNPPCTINTSPLFATYPATIPIGPEPGKYVDKYQIFQNFKDTYQRFKDMRGENIKKEIEQTKSKLPKRYVLLVLVEVEEWEDAGGGVKKIKKTARNFTLTSSPNELNEFKSAIPLHFQQFHTKYVVRTTQDEVNEIPTNLVFMQGYKKDNSNWADEIELLVSMQNSSDEVVYHVFYSKKNKIEQIYQFNQLILQPILSFPNWMKIYYQESEWDRYLRANHEQRKIAQAAYVKNYITSVITKSIGGALGGGLLAYKSGAAIGAFLGTGPIGWAVGAAIGFGIVAVKFIVDEIAGTTERHEREAREQDLRENSSPPLPSITGSSYLIIHQNNEETKMHQLGIYVTEVVSFGWEWKYNFKDFKTLGESSQKLLNNLINFGEKCLFSETQFNLFDYVVNHKTDQEKFYIHFASVSPQNDVYYSNIFNKNIETVSALMLTGIRFHFQDEA